MDVSNLPASHITAYDKELRLGIRVNALMAAMERHNLVERDEPTYYQLLHFAEEIVQYYEQYVSSLVQSTVILHKDPVMPDAVYKKIYSYMESIGKSKDYVLGLMTEEEIEDKKNRLYSELQIEKVNMIKLKRLQRDKKLIMERCELELLEMNEQREYGIFTTLTAKLGFEKVFLYGEKAMPEFINKFRHMIADAWLTQRGLKSTVRTRKPILDDVCRYIRILEDGDKNGRRHCHIFWRIKALPPCLSNPHEVNRIGDIDFMETFPAMSALWGHGISTHQPLRYNGDAWTELGFPCQKELAADGSVVQKEAQPLTAALLYIVGYLHKSFELTWQTKLTIS